VDPVGVATIRPSPCTTVTWFLSAYTCSQGGGRGAEQARRKRHQGKKQAQGQEGAEHASVSRGRHASHAQAGRGVYHFLPGGLRAALPATLSRPASHPALPQPTCRLHSCAVGPLSTTTSFSTTNSSWQALLTAAEEERSAEEAAGSLPRMMRHCSMETGKEGREGRH